MSLRSSLNHVLQEYLKSNAENFAQHPLASFIRNDLCDSVSLIVGDTDRLLFKGSAGQGNWAKGPWVGIFDQIITASAQSGYYPVYLFREQMRGVYLSLNQGMTEAKSTYKSDAKTALQARAIHFRAMLGEQIKRFPIAKIDLAPSSASNDTAFYEAGNICAVYYPAEQLPDEERLISDLSAMVQLYENLIFVQTDSESIQAQEEDSELSALAYEDASRFRLHKRIERNATLSKKVKRLKGYTCQVCSTNFEKKYGEIGKNFIEAHHLKPISTLKGKKVALNPDKDFAVLCSNCHRMIHRSEHVADVETFRSQHYKE